MSNYLSADELADLVGCKPNQRIRMAAWLKENHWPHEIDIKGMPKVSRAYHDSRMSGGPVKPKHATEPNLEAFAQRLRGREANAYP